MHIFAKIEFDKIDYENYSRLVFKHFIKAIFCLANFIALPNMR